MDHMDIDAYEYNKFESRTQPKQHSVTHFPSKIVEIDQHSNRINEVEQLPVELLLKIFFYLSDDLVSAGKVCTAWNAIIAGELYDRGMYMMEVMHDNFSAIKEFTRCIAVQQNYGMAYFKRGVAQYKESEEEEALKDINTALSLGPVGPDYHIIRSMKYQIKLNFKGSKGAVKEATKAIELDPMSGSAYYLRGYNRFDLQDYQGSISDLTYCLSLPYPYKSKVYNCRGWCYKIIGEIDKALSDFTISSRLNVRYTKPFVNKAIVLTSLKDRPKMMDEEQYLSDFLNTSQEGDIGAVYYTRAAIRQQWERYEEAIEDYQRAIAHNYHSIHKAYVSIGWCYEKLLKFEQAIAEYNHALAVNPKYSIALEHRAGAKCRLDSKAAEEDCKLAIQINPRNLSFSYRYLAAVVADNNDYTQAIKMLSDGLKVNPLDTDMLINRAGYYTCHGKLSLAIADYDLCLKHRPDNCEARKYRANARFACGDVEGAEADYRAALQLAPEDFGILNNCGIALLVNGDFAEGLKHLNAALAVHSETTDMSLDLLNQNIALANLLQENQPVKHFEVHFCTDPVYEKDEEKKMQEVVKKRLAHRFKLQQQKSSFKTKLASKLHWQAKRF